MHEGKVEENLDSSEYGWNATCSCGWKGNNPHQTEEDAKESLQSHYESVEIQLKGLGG